MRDLQEHRRARDTARKIQQARQQRHLPDQLDDDLLNFNNPSDNRFDGAIDDGIEDDKGDDGVWSRGARLQRSASLSEDWDQQDPTPPSSPPGRSRPLRP